ncbi:hypothetical protein HBB16_05795 [Pseudonocardia sp. MCCB 268]|nr:hypothetical protein [Pseudonocardia cytotoxica]
MYAVAGCHPGPRRGAGPVYHAVAGPDMGGDEFHPEQVSGGLVELAPGAELVERWKAGRLRRGRQGRRRHLPAKHLV